MKKLKSLCVMPIALETMLGMGTFLNTVSAQEPSIPIKAHAYELDDKSSYDFSSASEVSSMTFGKKTLGEFSISANVIETGTYRNTPAYGVSGNVSFSYSYDGSFQTSVLENWNLITDEGTTVGDIELSGSIGKGALIVQTCHDGSTWNNAVNPVTNFYESNPSGRDDFYTTSGEDIAQGTYYRVIFAYKMGQKTGTTGWGPWKKDVFAYKKHVEVYQFYLVVGEGNISIHNLATDSTSFENEGVSSTVLQKGETLVDGSMTTKGFSIDKLGSSVLVGVSKDGGKVSYVNDGATFTENGRYTVTTITKFGKQRSQTIYVFNGSSDNGFSTYFDGNLILSKRVFREGSYPTYILKDSCLKIKAINDNIPKLSGIITNITTNKTITLAQTTQEQRYDVEVGEYIADLYCGNINNGSVYNYQFHFNVIDSNAKPYVNYKNLYTTERVSDFKSKHYEVSYQTTRGGYIFVCFDLTSYDEAFEYAYQIEKRFIEKEPDGLYYKSEDNPNVKVKYVDYVDMTSVLNKYAKQNVRVAYFNALDEFTYRTYNNDLLDNLESLSISKSIKIFPSEEEKLKLIDRQPFINDFTFIRAAEYDVKKVEAYCKANKQTYTLEFGKSVNEQLNVSSIYTITETNSYGEQRIYDVFYLADNTTYSTWAVTNNDTTKNLSVSKDIMQDGVSVITADSIAIKDIYNNFDKHSIVTIKAPDVHSTEIKCGISELSKLCLYEKGTYEISFIDRTGHSYRFIAKITGNLTYEAAVSSKKLLSYNEFYDAVNQPHVVPSVDDSDNNQNNSNNNSSNNNTSDNTGNNTQNTPTTDDDNFSENKDPVHAKKLSWWVITLISVGTLIVLLIATFIAFDDAELWVVPVWLLAIAALVLMFIFTTWAWWVISLIELGGIVVLTIIAAELGKNLY